MGREIRPHKIAFYSHISNAYLRSMNWKRRLYYALSPKMRRLARRLYYYPVDLYEGISGKRDEITPPKGKIFIGPGDFKRLGEKLTQDFIRYGGLQNQHRVLDIGCGIGRIAIPLTKFLSKEGSYEGFDIVEDGIDWCSERITPKFPNFKFKHIPLRNDLYNLTTNSQAAQFVFPYDSNQFDFIILTSVFTHMQDKEVENYLKEIARVLKIGGKCFATFFIIDEASREYLGQTDKPFFTHDYGHYLLHDSTVKDANIAFTKSYIDQISSQAGLKISAFHPGWWAGRDKSASVDFQDVLIFEKASN